ncbi:hypothetical protein ROJ8625_02903 [Roseivivax jejudonensis]|uniref:Calpastatin n=1 Tax=Roseivivax jejudonensis TaxID=1529041 RepID=A0A1X6ZPP9_9RHOB|nr:DUF1810 domain-containing protein [Roseivivax jejudonensis]SLN57883.1 hypothetical protein ROJ8625_02903 [Roseivivax jejudonensis]
MAELSEFVAAQERCWPEVVSELTAGAKRTHWIWWVFPQLAVLGRSQRATHFGLSGLDEAAHYLAHPVLGPRLETAASLLLRHRGHDPEDMLGSVDALKVRSSMTLFEAVPGASECFAGVLDEMYGGSRCDTTRAHVRR